MTAGPRTCIVTGGASGIGLAATRRLVAEDWRVAVLDTDEAAIAEAQTAFAGAPVTVTRLDVTDEDRVAAEIAALGPVDGVVNVAGIARDAPLAETDAATFRRLLDVNVVGSFLVAREAVRRMEAGGAIVNVSSVSGLRGNVGRAAYGASKGAVITMTQVMAVELAPRRIRVNAVAPGPVDTPMVQALHDDGIRAEWTDGVPMGRYGTPEEVAGAIRYLLSDDAAYVTGHVLAVDGGFLAQGVRRRD